jgi:hypothetical protein
MGFYASTLLLLCILWELRRMRSFRVRFGGWKDDAIRAKHFGSFNVFETEVSAGREVPQGTQDLGGG